MAKKYLIRTLRAIPLVVFGFSCLLGVVALSTFTVDKMFETEWVWNDMYDPTATPEYGEDCSYDYAQGEVCGTVVINGIELDKGYYISSSDTWGFYGHDEHTSFLGNDVPSSPMMFFMLVYGALFVYAARKLVNGIDGYLNEILGRESVLHAPTRSTSAEKLSRHRWQSSQQCLPNGQVRRAIEPVERSSAESSSQIHRAA